MMHARFYGSRTTHGPGGNDEFGPTAARRPVNRSGGGRGAIVAAGDRLAADDDGQRRQQDDIEGGQGNEPPPHRPASSSALVVTVLVGAHIWSFIQPTQVLLTVVKGRANASWAASS